MLKDKHLFFASCLLLPLLFSHCKHPQKIKNSTTSPAMKRIIKTTQAPAPIGPYSQAVQFGNTLYLSGQIALNPATNQINNADLETETRQVMENIKAIIAEAGFEMSDIVKTTIFLSDMVYFQRVNQVYASYFTENFPARETVQVAGLPLKVNVEISVIAVKENPQLHGK
jgi:2-iminobutanoate/2-iminopropanoate deaminase